MTPTSEQEPDDVEVVLLPGWCELLGLDGRAIYLRVSSVESVVTRDAHGSYLRTASGEDITVKHSPGRVFGILAEAILREMVRAANMRELLTREKQ